MKNLILFQPDMCLEKGMRLKMKGFQKLVKYAAIAFGLYLAISIIGALVGVIIGVTSGVEVLKGFSEDENVEVSDETRNFDELSGLNLNISSSNLTIKAEGDSYRMEAHNIPKTTKIECKNDVLEIKNAKTLKSESSITIYVPENAKLSRINLDMGAGNVEISNIEATNIDFSFGAGNVNIKNLKSENPTIECGAGQVKFENTELTDAKLSAGVGKVIYSGKLNGESRIECGVGGVEMNLEGGRDNYSIKVQKGIGNIKINNESVTDNSTTGNGQNKIYIEGGVGNIDIEI